MRYPKVLSLEEQGGRRHTGVSPERFLMALDALRNKSNKDKTLIQIQKESEERGENISIHALQSANKGVEEEFKRTSNPSEIPLKEKKAILKMIVNLLGMRMMESEIIRKVQKKHPYSDSLVCNYIYKVQEELGAGIHSTPKERKEAIRLIKEMKK